MTRKLYEISAVVGGIPKGQSFLLQSEKGLEQVIPLFKQHLRRENVKRNGRYEAETLIRFMTDKEKLGIGNGGFQQTVLENEEVFNFLIHFERSNNPFYMSKYIQERLREKVQEQTVNTIYSRRFSSLLEDFWYDFVSYLFEHSFMRMDESILFENYKEQFAPVFEGEWEEKQFPVLFTLDLSEGFKQLAFKYPSMYEYLKEEGVMGLFEQLSEIQKSSLNVRCKVAEYPVFD